MLIVIGSERQRRITVHDGCAKYRFIPGTHLVVASGHEYDMRQRGGVIIRQLRVFLALTLAKLYPRHRSAAVLCSLVRYSTSAPTDTSAMFPWFPPDPSWYCQLGRHLRHCFFSLARNPLPQQSISTEATEKFVGMKLLVPSFEGEWKRSTRPAIRVLTAGTL
jgi:hypothetical protein